MTTLRTAIGLFLAVGVVTTTATAGDLSRYRNFELGTDLATVVKQVGADPAQVRVIHSRPAVIQELEWHPQPLGTSSRSEPAKEVLFSFYDGELFRIAVRYDRSANLEAKRLDDLEAPQRDAARIASEEEASKTKLENARLLNKPRFRP